MIFWRGTINTSLSSRPQGEILYDFQLKLCITYKIFRYRSEDSFFSFLVRNDSFFYFFQTIASTVDFKMREDFDQPISTLLK
jgi:hypothetical protein